MTLPCGHTIQEHEPGANEASAVAQKVFIEWLAARYWAPAVDLAAIVRAVAYNEADTQIGGGSPQRVHDAVAAFGMADRAALAQITGWLAATCSMNPFGLYALYAQADAEDAAEVIAFATWAGTIPLGRLQDWHQDVRELAHNDVMAMTRHARVMLGMLGFTTESLLALVD